MGQAQLSVDHGNNDAIGGVAERNRVRLVPDDWYVDPAEPDATDFHNKSLDDAATAFLAAHEEDATEADGAEAIWIGLQPGKADLADDGELGWQTDALCAQTDPEAFFPEKGGSTRDAKKVCGSCNVKAQCLEYALANDERFGIWGGLSERERRRLRKRAV